MTAPLYPTAQGDALQLLRPLATVNALPNWTNARVDASTSCTIAEVTVDFLPATVFRIHTTMNCSLGALAEVLQEESSLRFCDPSVDALILLEDSPASHTTTVYTSHKQPSLFVAARDFVVRSTQQIMDLSEWQRVAATAPPPTPTPSSAPTRVFVQSSVSTTHPTAPVGWKGKQYVRGTVHLFGYVAVEGLSRSPSANSRTLQVTNYCCVDPNGSLPQWLVKAAIGQQAQKLAKLRELCQRRKDAFVPVAPSASVPAAAAPAGCAVEHDDDGASSSDSFRTARSLGSQSVLSFEAADSADAPDRTQRALTFASTSTTPVGQHREEREERDEPEVPHHTGGVGTSPSQEALSPTPRPPVTPTNSTAELPRSLEKDTLQRLSALARATGWTLYEESDDGTTVERLTRLPFLFASLLRGRELPLALRVSRLVACRLAVMAALLDDTAEDDTAAWDPALVPILHASRASSPASAAPLPSQDGAAVRHYRFEKFRAGEPWSATLTTTPCTLRNPAVDGARLGFFTPGMRGACHVWGGLETGKEHFPEDPHSRHRDVRTLSFGLVATAVPGDAHLVRLSHYALVDFSGKRMQEIGARTHRSMLRQLSHNMKARVEALAALALARARDPRTLSPSRDRVATAATRPALWALLESVRSVEQAGSHDSDTLTCQGERGSVVVQVQSVPAVACGSAGRVYLFMVAVRCSLMTACTWLGASGGDVPLLPPLESLDPHVAGLRQLPSPAGAAIFQVSYAPECPSFSDLTFCFMEVSGMLMENDYRAFVLSRVNCSTPGRDAATLHCDGYVVEPPRSATAGHTDGTVRLRHIIATDVCSTCRDDIMNSPSSTSNTFVSEQAAQLVRLADSLERLPNR